MMTGLSIPQTLSLWFKVAKKEIKNNFKMTSFLIFNLALGLTGFLILQSFQLSLRDQIQMNAKELLGADLAVSVRRLMTEEEKKVLNRELGLVAQSTFVTEFFAMASFEQKTRLVLVKSIEDDYPFYGAMIGESQQKLEARALRQQNIWISPELLASLGVTVSQKVKLGKTEFLLKQIIEKDGTQSFRSASWAPRVYIHQSDLESTGLIQFGSTLTQSYLFKMNSSSAAQEESLSLKMKSLYQVLTDPQIRIDTASSAGEDSGRQLGYLMDYLGLVALVSLVLALLGAGFLYRWYLQSQMANLAILRSQGLSTNDLMGIQIIFLITVSLLSLIPSVLFVLFLGPFLVQSLESFLPITFDWTLHPKIVPVALGISLLSTLTLGFPFLVSMKNISVSILLRPRAQEALRISKISFIPLLVFFGLFAIIQAHSVKTGLYFTLGVLVFIVICLLIGYLGLKALSALNIGKKRWGLFVASKSLIRNGATHGASLIALSLGLFLVNLLPQLKNSLQTEFALSSGSVLPSLFLFDIQEEQEPELQLFLKEAGVPLSAVYPMVRARILTINGNIYEREVNQSVLSDRDSESEARYRNRGVNLSYVDTLANSDQIIEGVGWKDVWNPESTNLPQASVETKYAEKMKLKLGDIFEFDIQGVSIKARITSFRKVKWASFQPNFYILLQGGALDGAPKTFVASVPRIDSNEKSRLQFEIAEKFSNVSAIDVDRAITDILKMAQKMSWSLELMAFLSVFCGLVVLYSVVRSEVRRRKAELNLFKVQGAQTWDLFKILSTELIALGLLACAIGILPSMIAAGALSILVFQVPVVITGTIPFLSSLCLLSFSVVIAYFACRDVITENPAVLLKES